jgi:signal transduction histidine kinase
MFEVRISPFKASTLGRQSSALLVIDDVTDRERLAALEAEAANLRLVKLMASHLAHEMGNAMLPVITNFELSPPEDAGADLSKTLKQSALEGCKRISRLVRQAQVLANDSLGSQSDFEAGAVLALAIQDAQTMCPRKEVPIQLESGAATMLRGDRTKLTHAISEVILNALQASPVSKPVSISAKTVEEKGSHAIAIEIRDQGAGFPPEAKLRAAEPFFTTKIVGTGLGLTVAKRIIELHNGRLEFPKESDSGTVRIMLPLPPNNLDATNGKG